MNSLFKVVIVAGPNGAGKTTFASQYLPKSVRQYEYVNADEIVKTMIESGVASENANFNAGRTMLRMLDEHVEARRDLMLETTLSLRGYARQIPQWQLLGYDVLLYYLRLPDVEHAIERVRRRVAAGGHDIPEADIRRRFARSLEYLENLYKPIVDEWHVFDSLDGKFSHVASGGRK